MTKRPGLMGPFKCAPAPHGVDDISGKRFGRLVVEGFIRRGRMGVQLWLCRCDCGNIVGCVATKMKAGKKTSCGCALREKNRILNTKHGHGSQRVGRSPEYQSWRSMRERCLNPNHSQFRYYGGRGVSICERWLTGTDGATGFECFLRDMGPRPPSKTLDRIDGHGNYEPLNCRWAVAKRQIRNRSNSVSVSIGGVQHNLADYCESKNLDIRIVRIRLQSGATDEEAIRPTRLGWRAA